MEPLDVNNRQSGISALMNREKVDRINTDRIYTSSHNMAASTLVSPTSIPSYTNNPPPPPYSQGWQSPHTRSRDGLISPPDSRRTSDNKTEPPPPIQTAPQHRQSLPSIQEALNSAPKPNPYASPVSASLPPTHQQFPYPQPHTVPRSYPSEPTPFASQPRQPSPLQPIHPQANSFGRPEAVPASFPELRRNSLTTAPPPVSHYGGRPYEPTRYEQDQRGHERMSNGYTHQPPQQQQGSYQYGPPTPQGHHPSFSDPRYPPRDPRDQIPMDAWKGRDEEKQKFQPAFRQGLKRHLDVWDFENNLAQINTASSTLQEWSGHYNAIAQEQQRHIPDRMPTVESCDEMISQNIKIQHALERMKETIHQQQFAVAADMQQRHHGLKGPGDYDDEMSMYGEDNMKNPIFGPSESKKRRGRAAPPGRCHSCNRAETPEWRRGPDGARTLCNACGLHYAKLTRKNGIKGGQPNGSSSLRPKSMDDHSPRP